jgi:hypothetical protein
MVTQAGDIGRTNGKQFYNFARTCRYKESIHCALRCTTFMQLKGNTHNYPVRSYSDITEIKSKLLSYNFIVSAARHGKSVNDAVMIISIIFFFFFLSLILFSLWRYSPNLGLGLRP